MIRLNSNISCLNYILITHCLPSPILIFQDHAAIFETL